MTNTKVSVNVSEGARLLTQMTGRPYPPETVQAWTTRGIGGRILPSKKVAGLRLIDRNELITFAFGEDATDAK